SPGRTWESLARATIDLLDLGDVLDAGGGDGAVAELLAPRSKTYTLVDRNDKLLAAAAARLAGLPNVRIRAGDLRNLDLPRASFDVALLLNVLVETEEPAAIVDQL